MTMEKREATKQLSLQQKVVKIRKKIPALVKKTYSEEVNYDFVKIDDVYRYLAPAMNDYQVNWEVVLETATKKDELGNPLFVQYVAQSQMWMYEADLTLRWINAEDPQEADTVVIHAIGSHQFPDKAKGSAWTYAMKYYLLNKFCIDQGGEDPDMRALKTLEAELAGNGYWELDSQGLTGELEAEETDVSEAQEADTPETEMENVGMPEMETGEAGTSEAGQKASAVSGQPSKSQKQAAVQKEKASASGTPETMQKGKTLSQAPPLVSPHIKPESGTMVQLPESAKAELETGSGMTIEEAMQIKCTPGTYSDHTLGSLAQLGEEGIQALIWYAEGYRGRRQELREGARLLLNAAKAA